MNKFYKMELFRMRKMKSAYIIVLVLFLLFLLGGALDRARVNNTAITEETTNSLVLYADINEDATEVAYSSKIQAIASVFDGNIIPMAVLIFTGLFVGALHRSKFEKNICNSIGRRRQLTLVDTILCMCFDFIVVLVAIFSSTLGYMLFYPDFTTLPTGDIAGFLSFIIVYSFLLGCISVIMSLLTILISNQTAAIVIALIYGSGIPYDLLDFFLPFSVKRYVPYGMTCVLLEDSNNSNYYRTIIIALLYTIPALLSCLYVRRKRDISS